MPNLTRDQILAIAKSKGKFRVTLRWRDDRLRARCQKMKREGLLTGGRKITNGAVYFYPVRDGNAKRMDPPSPPKISTEEIQSK